MSDSISPKVEASSVLNCKGEGTYGRRFVFARIVVLVSSAVFHDFRRRHRRLALLSLLSLLDGIFKLLVIVILVVTPLLRRCSKEQAVLRARLYELRATTSTNLMGAVGECFCHRRRLAADSCSPRCTPMRCCCSQMTHCPLYFCSRHSRCLRLTRKHAFTTGRILKSCKRQSTK